MRQYKQHSFMRPNIAMGGLFSIVVVTNILFTMFLKHFT